MGKKEIYLVLINKRNSIPEGWLQQIELIDVKDTESRSIKIEKKTWKQYQKFKSYISKKIEMELAIDSAYRGEEEQKEIYQKFIKIYGQQYANDFVAPLGHSEHQTGLAIDLQLLIEGEEYLNPNENFSIMEEKFIKMHPYLAEFGFILRYPKGKENVTGYPYEPWHIRYVGKAVAKKIAQEKITLEEYLQYSRN